MVQKRFSNRIGAAAIILVLALTGCGKKEEETGSLSFSEQDQVSDQALEDAGAPDGASDESPVEISELTKVSSQGAASEQARGVFVSAAQGDPEAVYLARCQYCHVALGPGTITLARRLGEDNALLADRTDLTTDYVNAVVRNGLTTMPPISRVEVSDEELHLIGEYLTRNNDRE